jgi:hypothetical protein
MELNALKEKICYSQILVFVFVDHGGRRPEHTYNNNSGWVEYLWAGTIVSIVPKSCSFTMFGDYCHSGGMIESVEEVIGHSIVDTIMNRAKTED